MKNINSLSLKMIEALGPKALEPDAIRITVRVGKPEIKT